MRQVIIPCSLLALAAALGFSAGELRSSDWPQWRGPNRDGVSKETGLLDRWPDAGPPLVWDSQKVNGGDGVGTGYSSVAVADGRIYTVGDINRPERGCHAFCLDEKTGKHIWSTKFAPAGGDGPRSTPTVDGDRVYVLSRQGILACLATEDGRALWTVDYKNDLGGRMMSGWDYSESVLIDGDRLLCTPGSDDAAVVALDKRTGKVVWKARIPDCGGAGYASVVTADVGGVKQYITLFGNCIAAVRADDGRFLWRYDRVANGTANIPTPIVDGDLVFCSTAYNTGAALLKLVPTRDGGIDAREVYFLDHRKVQNHHGGVVKVGGYIYGGQGHNDGQPFCLEMKTGKLMWGPVRGVGEGSAAIVYADGHLYYRYEGGRMVLVKADPDEFELVSAFELPRNVGARNWPHPVVANGCLYIRGNGMLLCYDIAK